MRRWRVRLAALAAGLAVVGSVGWAWVAAPLVQAPAADTPVPLPPASDALTDLPRCPLGSDAQKGPRKTSVGLKFKPSDVRAVFAGAGSSVVERFLAEKGTDGLPQSRSGRNQQIGVRAVGAKGVLVGCGRFNATSAEVTLPSEQTKGSLTQRQVEAVLAKWVWVPRRPRTPHAPSVCGSKRMSRRTVVAVIGVWRSRQHAANPNHCFHELLWPLAHACTGGDVHCVGVSAASEFLRILAQPSAQPCRQLFGALLSELGLCIADAEAAFRDPRPLLVIRTALPGAGGGHARHPRCAVSAGAHSSASPDVALDALRQAGLRLRCSGCKPPSAPRPVLLSGRHRRRALFYSRRRMKPQRRAGGRRAVLDIDSWNTLRDKASALGADVVDVDEFSGPVLKQVRLMESVDMAVWVAGGQEAWTLWAPPHFRILQWEPCWVHEPVSWMQWWCPMRPTHCLRTLVASSCAGAVADLDSSTNCVEPRWMDLRINGTVPAALKVIGAWLSQRDWRQPPPPGGECIGDSTNVVHDWRRKFCSPDGAAAALKQLMAQ